jgi:hypothetical protein
VLLQSAVLLNAGPHGVPAATPLSVNLLGVDTFLPLRLRRTAVRRLGGIMAAEGCSCQRCRVEVSAVLLLLWCCSGCMHRRKYLTLYQGVLVLTSGRQEAELC